MTDDYAYPIAQCDVASERRAALQSYRRSANRVHDVQWVPKSLYGVASTTAE
jgi:hypothetical protein